MKKLLFLDTETTGLGKEDRLVQIAFKSSHIRNGHIVNLLFKPPVPISFEAMATHHITEDMVKDADVFAECNAFKEIKKLLADHVLIAHNAEFDIGMLKREGIQVDNFICTQKIALNLWDEPSYKLQYLRYKLELEIEGTAHSADGDVAVLEALFNYIYKLMEDGDHEAVIAQMIEISKRPVLLRRMPFGKHRGVEFAKIPMDYLQWLSKQPELSTDLEHTINHYL